MYIVLLWTDCACLCFIGDRRNNKPIGRKSRGTKQIETKVIMLFHLQKKVHQNPISARRLLFKLLFKEK